jgi:hypothetical protein
MPAEYVSGHQGRTGLQHQMCKEIFKHEERCESTDSEVQMEFPIEDISTTNHYYIVNLV